MKGKNNDQAFGKDSKFQGCTWAADHNFGNIHGILKTQDKEMRHPDPSVFACLLQSYGSF